MALMWLKVEKFTSKVTLITRSAPSRSISWLAFLPLPYTRASITQMYSMVSWRGGMSSGLFVEIRENRGLAYAVSSFVKTSSDVGAFGVHAAVDNDRVEETSQGYNA